MKTIRDINVKNKTILVRVDYNVPMKNGKITEDLRIKASLPTINYLLDHDAKRIILISHLGRPDGKTNSKFSLAPIAKTLQKLLPGQPISFCSSSIDKVSIPDTAKIVLLENLRFDPREEQNSVDFAKEIINATNAEIFVQDGFAVIHRAHTSTDAIARLLPSCAGLLLERELTNLGKILQKPTRPVLLIIGGAKVEDKQPLIDKFIKIEGQGLIVPNILT